MAITLRPEHEQLVSEALRSGVYRTPDEVIGRALEMLKLQDQWLHDNRGAIHEKIARGLAQLDRGKGVSGEASRAHLQERKKAWLADNEPTS